MQHALRLKPWDKDLWYNLAITLHDSAQSRFENKKSTSKEMALAEIDFEAAHPMFSSLKNISPTVRRNYRTTICNSLEKICEVTN